MGYAIGYYKNAQGQRVYGRHSTSPGYYNKAGKWVNSGSKPRSGGHGHGHGGGSGSGGGTGGGTTPTPPADRPTRASKRPAIKAGESLASGARQGFGDGGPSELADSMGYAPAPYKRKFQLNLDNDEEKAQGSQNEWAIPSSVSALITGQLRQGQNAPADYWDQWAKDKGGQTTLQARSSSPFGMDVSYNPQQQQTQSSPFGAFDAAMNIGSEQQEQSDPKMSAELTKWLADQGYKSGGGVNDGSIESVRMAPNNPGSPAGTPASGDPASGTPASGTPASGDPASGIPPVGAPPSGTYPGEGQLYNYWAAGEGGEHNQMGPSSAMMAQSTMEAMQLANAFFAPQRMELAYELGDMETDMRRTAVSLGRQIDDPVLQAKLYKEGMRAVRTMDIQQNTMAFQMAEQRRKEDMQNFQFYDQLSQEEYRLKLANDQFVARYNLDVDYYKLQRTNVVNNSQTPPTANTTPPSTQPAAAGAAKTVDTAGNLLSQNLSRLQYNPYSK